MSDKYVKNEELLHPERYMQNKIESWDFTLRSLFPHTIATVVEYVIRYKHKGGLQDLEKAINWAKKASESYEYLRLCRPLVGSQDNYFELVPEVSKENFPDLNEVQRMILNEAQILTSNLGSKEQFTKSVESIIELLGILVEESELEGIE
jgi:hypothetical protein